MKVMRYGADDWGSEDEDEDYDENQKLFDLFNENNLPKINFQLFLGIFLGLCLGKKIL
tara:strand:- start:501 stop:674 length:174 start_codon:yes stop_codon:yes gene_type:complete